MIANDWCIKLGLLLIMNNIYCLTLIHSERPKLYGVLTVLSAIGLNNFLIGKTQNSKKSKASEMVNSP